MKKILATLTVLIFFNISYATEQDQEMKDRQVIHKEAMQIIGIKLRTSNAPDAGPKDIPLHWEKFYSENILEKIPHKISNEVIALYCDYEGDYTQPYSLIIGCVVSSVKDIPEGLVVKTLPETSYAIVPAIGEHPKKLIQAWGNIWQSDLKRTYTGDFELYGENFAKESPQKVEVYIAIEDSED